MKLKLSGLLIIIIISFSFFSLADTHPPDCSCQQFRKLFLSSPPLEGEDVEELQRELKKLGYYSEVITGLYNWETYQAVKKFQENYISQDKGVVTRKTWSELARALNKEPAVEATNDQLSAPEGKVSLLINTYKKQLTVYSDGEVHYTFPVAVGKPSTKSPVGEWAIIEKDAHWGGGFGERWMGLNVPWGKYGIHGTNKPGSIGTAASHGCIRMYNRDVKKLYPWVDIGTRVKIIGERDPIKITHSLKPGQTGKDVLLFQEKLREYNFKPGYTDGRFGEGTKRAVREFKYIYGLRDDLVCGESSFYILNLK